jgi:hypothetical protein
VKTADLNPIHTTPMFDGAKPKGLRHTYLVRGSAGDASPGFLGLLRLASKTAHVPNLTTVRLPIPWEPFGLPATLQTRTTCLVDGPPAWGWDGLGPKLGIPAVEATTGATSEGWDLDHVVLLVPDLATAIDDLASSLGSPRLRTEVKGRLTAFYRVGPLLEVIESPVRAAALYGLALVTTHSLEVTVLNWRTRGLDVTDPQRAIQPGRRIFSVRGTEAGLAVMSPDGAIPPKTR